MIFITIGTQLPFDRFIQVLDEISEGIEEKFIVQALNGKYIPKNFDVVDFINPDEYDQIINEARLIISHAGMGSILSAIEYNKPIIIFPRLASFGEHRNDHQMATAMAINDKGYAYVAYDKKRLSELIHLPNLAPLTKPKESNVSAILTSILNHT